MHCALCSVQCVACSVFTSQYNSFNLSNFNFFRLFFFLKFYIGKRNNAQIASKSKTHSHANGHQRAKTRNVVKCFSVFNRHETDLHAMSLKPLEIERNTNSQAQAQAQAYSLFSSAFKCKYPPID